MSLNTNLLTAAQADMSGSSALSTLYDLSLGGGGSAVRDTSTMVYGAASARITTDGSGTYQFVCANVPIALVSPNETITLSAYVRAASGGSAPTLRFYCEANNSLAGYAEVGAVTTITPTSTWQRYSITVTLPASLSYSGYDWSIIGLRLDTGGTAQANTFWLDCLQIEAGATASPWVPGTAGVPPSQGVYRAYIGGFPVQSLAGSMQVQNQVGQRSTGGVQVWGPLGVLWQYGTQTQLYDETGTLAYSGYTTKDKATRSGGVRQGTGYLEHNVSLMDNCYRADKRRVFRTYSNLSAGAIVADLLGAYLAGEGVTSTPTSIAQGATISEIIWSGSKSVADALSWLAQQSGYWWNIDHDGVLWFQPYAGIPAPFTLDGTQADSMIGLSVEAGNEVYVNKQYVKGSYGETGLLTETFVGDGVSTSFTLGYEVSSIKTVLLNGTDITRDVLTKGSSGGQWYYAIGDPVITEDPSQTVLTGSDTMAITYKGRYPVLAVAQNPALVTAQKAREGGVGTGLIESVYSNTKVRTLTAAFGIANALLSHYGQDAYVLTFSTRTKGLMAGQMLTVNLPDFALTNRQALISGVTLTDGIDGHTIWYQVTAVGGPVDASQWQTFWQALMQQSSDPSDYTDTSDTALALLSTSMVTHTPSITITTMPVAGAICGVSMLCGQWTVN